MSMWSRYLKDFRSIADYFGNECQSSTECNVQYSTEYSSVFNQFPFSHRRLCGLLKLVFAILFKSVKSVCLILKHTPLNPDIV